MAHKEHLLYMYNTNPDVIKKLIDDVSEVESMARADDKGNHIRWHVGHLIYSDRHALSMLTGQPNEDDPYSKLFGYGSECVDVAATYPSFKQLHDDMYAVHADLIAAAEKVSENNLEAMVGDEGKEKPAWNMLTFLCLHEFYHAGQIVDIRRTIGRERPFG